MPRLNRNTKELIFDIAIAIFAKVGVEEANMRLIAKQAQIKAASIYNHYESKGQILAEIYRYYRAHFFDNLKSEAEIQGIIATGSRDEVIKALSLTFFTLDEVKYQRMVLITKMIYMRLFIDADAKAIFTDLMTAKITALVKSWLDYGVEIARFRPFDTATFAQLYVDSKHVMGIKAFSDPDYQVQQLEVESKIDALIAELLPFAK